MERSQKQAHAVCVPFPAQGHINPMMDLAKLLHSRGFFITFVNTEFNHNRLIRSRSRSSSSLDWVTNFPDFNFETMPEGLPESDRDATQDPWALAAAIRRNSLSAMRGVLERVGSTEGMPRVTCIVCDGVMSAAGVEAAAEIGVPVISFWTASACGFMAYLHYPHLQAKGIVPFLYNDKYEEEGILDTEVDWIPGMDNIRLRDLPTLFKVTDPNDSLFTFIRDEVQNCLKSDAIIFNTFNALEHQVLAAIKSIFPNIYTIGPLSLLVQNHVPESPLKSFRPSLWKDDGQCLDWLDQFEPKSVVYVSYGCITVMTKENVIEFAWGLANSNHPFLWVLRPDVMMGEPAGSLPEEFMVETRGRGLIVDWCPQDKVLGHSSIGVFLTHCGWNSMLESVFERGVPLICWPYFAEQTTNRCYACDEEKWGVGIEIKNEVKRSEVEDSIREVLDGGEYGKRIRERALDWKNKAENAAALLGSSFSNFDALFRSTLLTKSQKA